MPGGHDPGHLVHGKTHVIALGLDRLARMDAHAHPDPPVLRPVVLLEPSLRIRCSSHRSGGRGKRCEDRVALSAKDPSAGGLDGRGDQRTVRVKQCLVAAAERLEEARRTFDVCEQEGRRARRASGHAQNDSNCRSVPGQERPRLATDWSCLLVGSTCFETWVRNWRACLRAVLTPSLK